MKTMRNPIFSLLKLPLMAALIGVALQLSLSAQTPNDALTLEQAIQAALRNRMELRAYEQRAIMVEKELKANQLRYIPQISAGVDVKYNAILATSIVPIGKLNPGNPTDEVAAVRFGTNWANGAGLTLNQVVYDPTIRGAREMAELNGELSAAQKAQRAEAITVAVAQAFYALQVSEAEVDYARSDSVLAQTKLADLRLRLQEGRALATDVEAAELDSASARLRLADIRRNAADWRAQLAYQMGIGLESAANIRLSEGLEQHLETHRVLSSTESPSPVPSAASNLQAIKVQQTVQLTENEKAGYKPSLMLNGFLGANHFSDTFDPWKGAKWFPTSFIGLSLNMPLTEGFIRQQRIQRLEANRLADQMDLAALHDQTDLEFERAKIALSGAEDALAMQLQLMDLAEKRLALAQERAQAERALPSDVTQAQNQVQNARFQYLRRCYDLLMADLEMRRLCGLLKF